MIQDFRICLSIYGYSDRLHELAVEILQYIKKFEIKKIHYEDLKKQQIQKLKDMTQNIFCIDFS